MKNIIFIAPPASGKGTISDYLVNNFDYNHISTGDLLRGEINKKSEIGLKINDIIKSGQLVSDDIITELLKNNLLKIKGSFILDGYPRNINQAIKLDEILNEIKVDNLIVINLTVPKDVLKNRITGRISCPNCHAGYNENIPSLMPKQSGICDQCNTTLEKRSDDNAETFEIRYQTYLDETKPVLAYYQDQGIVRSINVDRALNEIFNDIEEMVSED